MSVAGIVLAGGASSRMGSPKALLEIRGVPFIHHILSVLASTGVSPVVVVTGTHHEAIGTVLDQAHPPGVTVVKNAQHQLGQLRSLQVGLEAVALHQPDRVLVWPVDAPAVRVDTVRRLLAAGRALVVRPAVGGRHGHPVLFDVRLFGALRRAAPDMSARDVVRALAPGEVVDLDFGDAGVVFDVDTPGDYERMKAEVASGALAF